MASVSSNRSTSSLTILFRSGANLLFFCLTGGNFGSIFKLCIAISGSTPGHSSSGSFLLSWLRTCRTFSPFPLHPSSPVCFDLLLLILRKLNLRQGPSATSFAEDLRPDPSATSFAEDLLRIKGLETLDYLDNLKNREWCTKHGDALTFESEVDKIYLSTPTKIAILDHEKKRTFVIHKDELPNAVFWNPWDKKAKAMTDFGNDEYKHMVCVEAAVVEKPVMLKPGEEWRGQQELSAIPSSYYSRQLDPQKVLQGN
ncbi:hypothetical protein UlMin_025702 [Ulmus minor]